MSISLRGSEYDPSIDPVESLQNSRRGHLSYFSRLCNDIDQLEIEFDSGCGDISGYLDSFLQFQCRFREAFNKYCTIHESLIRCQTIDLALMERLKSSHSKAVNRFNDKSLSLKSMMSVLTSQ